MSRPAIVYLAMLAVLIAGLWSVLAIGRHLHAPYDLAGKWQLIPVTPGPTQTVTVEQSGKFFQLAFEQGQVLDLKLKTPTDASTISLANSTSQLLVRNSKGEDDPDNKSFVLTGPHPGQWIAHRVVRAFPEDVSAEAGK